MTPSFRDMIGSLSLAMLFYPETANLTDADVQGNAVPLQHIHPHSFACRQFPSGRFAGPTFRLTRPSAFY